MNFVNPKEFLEQLGNTRELFVENGYESFRNEVIQAGAYFCRGNNPKPTDVVIQHQWGVLYIRLEYYLKQALGSTEITEYALDVLRKALAKYLKEDYTLRYPNQLGFVWYISKNRYIVKALITLQPTAQPTYVYLMNGEGCVMCLYCAQMARVETGLSQDSYMYVQEKHPYDNPPICDNCGCVLTDNDIVK